MVTQHHQVVVAAVVAVLLVLSMLFQVNYFQQSQLALVLELHLLALCLQLQVGQILLVARVALLVLARLHLHCAELLPLQVALEVRQQRLVEPVGVVAGRFMVQAVQEARRTTTT